MTTSRDELTPFVENYTDVFVKHVLSRVIIPSRCCRCRDAPEDAVPTNFVWCLVLRAVSRALRNAVPSYRTLVEEAVAGEKRYGSVPNEELRRVMCVRSMRRSPSLERYMRTLLSETARVKANSACTRAQLERIEECESRHESVAIAFRAPRCEMCQSRWVGCIFCAKTCGCATRVLCNRCDRGKTVALRTIIDGELVLACATCCSCGNMFCSDCGSDEPMVACVWCRALFCRECVEYAFDELCCDECGEYACELCQRLNNDPRRKCHECETIVCDLCTPRTFLGCAVCDRPVCSECLHDAENFVECSRCAYKALKSCAFDAGFRRIDADPNTILCYDCCPAYFYEKLEKERRVMWTQPKRSDRIEKQKHCINNERNY